MNEADKNKVVRKLLDMELGDATCQFCTHLTYAEECNNKSSHAFLSSPNLDGTCELYEALPSIDPNPDYTTWAGFGPAWEKAQTMPWWGEFWDWVYEMADKKYQKATSRPSKPEGNAISHGLFWMSYLTGIYTPEKCIIDRTRFRDLLYEFAVETGRDK